MAGESRLLIQTIKKVLKEAANPMHYKEITTKIEEEGIVDAPWQGVCSALSKRIREEGERCPWKRVRPGWYVMNESADWYHEGEYADGAYKPEEEASLIQEAGCFLELSELVKILECIRVKKNLILQGPPGTGKTWLAKRLTQALFSWEVRADSRERRVQFHPSLSYEDFVRGWRPAEGGKLTLVDGPFLKMVNTAKENPNRICVLVIEEINRGNPAQIFGEMLTLLEADKRNSEYALELIYPRKERERVYIPDNLYVIGTMNIADRSLALVDLALRRRFAFIDLEPIFGERWKKWVRNKCGVDLNILSDIKERIEKLNDQISDDSSLGPQFRIGHSYVTPRSGTPINDGREWFRQVVEKEIGPQLNEIWPDDPTKAQEARQDLLKGF